MKLRILLLSYSFLTKLCDAEVVLTHNLLIRKLGLSSWLAYGHRVSCWASVALELCVPLIWQSLYSCIFSVFPSRFFARQLAMLDPTWQFFFSFSMNANSNQPLLLLFWPVAKGSKSLPAYFPHLSVLSDWETSGKVQTADYRPWIRLWEIWVSGFKTLLWLCKNPPSQHRQWERTAVYTATHWWAPSNAPGNHTESILWQCLNLVKCPEYVGELLCRAQEEATHGGKSIDSGLNSCYYLTCHGTWKCLLRSLEPLFSSTLKWR